MQPGENTVRADVTVDEGHLLVAAIVIHVTHRPELPVHRGQWGIHNPFHARALWGLLAEDADFICHDLIPKQRRKAVKK
ncbi:hypothetical protein GCM10010276_24560 [Streptomyces longisporus]|uniref:Uncharacterized protein n=1 Tax=Streptomyces longisporus TaxID=1948 RepID=A0ABP5YRD4_STRLO